MNRTRKFLLLTIGVLTLFALFVWNSLGVFTRADIPKTDTMTVSFLDVGQGDAIYVRAPNGVDLLVDGGRDKSVVSRLKEVMDRGDSAIDIVVATHPDADHIGGLPQVFDNFAVGAFFDPGAFSDTKTYQTLMQKVSTEQSPYLYATSGTKIILDKEKNIFVDILYPSNVVKNVRDTNSRSVVLRLIYGETSFLLTGDAPIATESILVARSTDQPIRSTILKLGHHGSRTSSSRAFLQKVSPQVAIISSGQNNRYGHPHLEVLNVLKSLHIPYLATYDAGNIVYKSDSKMVTRVEK